MGITVKLRRPKTEPAADQKTEITTIITDADVALQEILPERYRARHPQPAATTKPTPVPTKPRRRGSSMGDVPSSVVMNYPRSGKRVLPAGTTKIDIKQGNVHLPDKTVEEMYATRKVDSCRCFALYTDRMIDIRLSMKGGLLFTSSVFPAWFRKLDMLDFDLVEIECTEPTTFYIVMSEVPDGVPEHYSERWLSPPSELGYNAADDLVEMKKVVNGVEYTRLIDDDDVIDKNAVKWIEFGGWSPT